MKEVLKWIDDHKEEMISDLEKLININSVEGEALPDAPFGQGPKDALLKFLEFGERDGFSTENLQNYAGDIEFGKGEESIGIIAHVDVVPAGSGWDSDPFKMENDGVYLTGRGTQDDKGPGIAAYYAMRAIKETGVPIKRIIRLILGTNEETHWGGINYYVEHKKMPTMGFTPDAEFPVIFGEKGIVTGTLSLSFDLKDSAVKTFKAGNAPNMVPDYAEIVLDKSKVNSDALSNLVDGLELKENGTDVVISANGKSAHGSTPEAGKNAISILLKGIEGVFMAGDEFIKFVEFYNAKLGFTFHGEGLGVDFEDEKSGKLNFNIGMIEKFEDKINIVLNMRFPLTGVTKEDIKAQIEKSTVDFNGTFEQTGGEDPLYIDPESKLIKILMSAYQNQSGDMESKPMVIGGGTYAKAMDNCVAFGSMFKDDEDRMHQKNERIKIDRLMDAAKIYAEALYTLATEEKVL